MNKSKENINMYTIAEITKTSPKTPPTYFDQFKEFKEPIVKWSQAGLDNKLYVKTHKLHNVEHDKLFRKIGEADSTDAIKIVNRIIEVNRDLL